MSVSNVTKAKLSNRVTSKEHFIVYVYSQKKKKKKPTQKQNPQTGAKEQFSNSLGYTGHRIL